jgi:hypothetical protein
MQHRWCDKKNSPAVQQAWIGGVSALLKAPGKPIESTCMAGCKIRNRGYYCSLHVHSSILSKSQMLPDPAMCIKACRAVSVTAELHTYPSGSTLFWYWQYQPVPPLNNNWSTTNLQPAGGCKIIPNKHSLPQRKLHVRLAVDTCHQHTTSGLLGGQQRSTSASPHAPYAYVRPHQLESAHGTFSAAGCAMDCQQTINKCDPAKGTATV